MSDSIVGKDEHHRAQWGRRIIPAGSESGAPNSFHVWGHVASQDRRRGMSLLVSPASPERRAKMKDVELSQGDS